MADKVIPLSRRYEAHGTIFDSVTLREPKLRDHFAIGDPVELHPGPDGTGRFVIENGDRVAAYLDRLAVPERPGRHALDDLDLVDSLAVKDAIIDFFTEANRRYRQPTNSSGAPDSPSATSSN